MLRIGDEPIPGYRLEKFLGRGQFGQVWKTTAPGGASAALKFLDLSGKEGWKEFKGVQRVKEIRHAHLMPITAFWLLDEDENVLDEDQVQAFAPPDSMRDTVTPGDIAQAASQPRWLVIAQLLGDKTLMDELEERKDLGERGIALPELLNYIEEAAKGIDFLNSESHDLGNGVYAVQHCDVKPANMLLLGGSVLVCDFGLAQILMTDGNKARSTGMNGSPAYIAPECIAQRPSATSDQYSLAVTYYELRTGDLPFEDQTPLGALDAHRSGDLRLIDIPMAEAEVLAKATALDPQDRFPDCLSFVQALKEAGGTPLRAPAPPSLASLVTKVAVTIAAILVAVVAILLVAPSSPIRLLNAPSVNLGGTRNVQFEIIPPDATVSVNGDEHQLTDGQVQLEQAADAVLNIVVSRGTDYEVQTMRVDLRELDAEEPISIQLERSAVFLAQAAAQKLRDGDLSAAVTDYAQAIRKDNRFTAFPAAIELSGSEPKESSVEIQFAQVSRDGRWLVAADKRGSVRGWHVDVRPSSDSRPTLFHQHQQSIRSLAVGKRWVISSDSGGNVLVSQLTDTPSKPKQYSLETYADVKLAISRDDRYALTGCDGELTRWDLTSFDIPSSEQLLGRHQDFIEVIRVPPDEKSVVTGSWDGEVKRWPLAGGTTEGIALGKLSDDVYVVEVSPAYVAFAGSELEGENQVWIADLDGSNVTKLPGNHPSPIVALAFSNSGSWLAAGSEDDGRLSVWQHDDSSGRWSRTPLPGQHTDTVQSLAFAPHLAYLFSSGNDGTVLLWDLEATRERVATIAEGLAPVSSLCVTPDGQWLIAAGVDGKIRVWEIGQCRLVKEASDSAGVKATPPGKQQSGVET